MLITQNGTTLEYLIAATTQLLDEGGVKAVTLREVGRRARVSHNAVYRHFTNRHALLAAVAELDLDDLKLLFTDALAPDSDTPLAELRIALRHLLVFARGRPARYRLFFSDADVAMANGSTHQKATAALDALATLIQACQDAGELAPGDPHKLAALIYGTVHGLIDLELGGRLQASKEWSRPEEIVELLLALVTRP